MRAVGYYRPAPLGDPRAAEAAAARIQAYCREEEHTLLELIGPDAPAPAAGKPQRSEDDQYAALHAFLDALGRGGALVVVPDAAHLADDLTVLVGRLIDLTAAGGEVRCADDAFPDPLQNGLDTLDFAGRSPLRARRIRESLMSKAARGEVLGRTPFGYAASIDGAMRIVPDEAGVVRRIFTLYAGPEPPDDAGEDTPPAGGPGLRRIAAALNADGLRTRAGHPWSPVAVAGVLRNRAYTGSYSRYGMRIVGSHERIVDRSLFSRAQAVLGARRPASRPRRADPYVLGGLARCGVCGRGVHGVTRNRRWQRADGSSAERSYRYYECPSRSGRRAAGEGADHPGWRAERLEAAVREALDRTSDNLLSASFRAPPRDSQQDAVRRAERAFLDAVRDAARGRRGLTGLVEPLAELQETRDAGAPEPARYGLDAALAGLHSEDPPTARRAFAALLDRVMVYGDRVELVLRPAPSG
ncbi:MAG: recombinase family protein [Dehalococcoidia bacterium]